jgi:predicted AAA+ superfamily ATPase
MAILERRLRPSIERLLDEQAAVAILGPRQVGKTTLARRIGETRPSIYFDLENPEHLAVLAEPRSVLARYVDRLVILDEVQRIPGLFGALRGLIDDARHVGKGVGQFLILGSASVELLRQSSETLAGRIAYRELAPFSLLEIDGGDALAADTLWVRGGFPGAYLAASDETAMTWRRDFIRTYLERDIPQFDSRVPAETLRRFWTMLAHYQGALLNVAKLASALTVDVRTVNRYLDLLVDLLLVRRLQPWSGNVGKRLVRSPKTYLRDSGIAHALLALTTLEDVLSHPAVGVSWEGFVIENLLSAAPAWSQPFFYRTSAGAEVDLVLEFSPTRRWAIEIKRSVTNPAPSRGFHAACDDLRAERRLVVYPGALPFPQARNVETLPVVELMRELLAIDADHAQHGQRGQRDQHGHRGQRERQ